MLFRFFEDCLMKTRFYAFGLVSVLGLFSSQAVLAADGTITFDGEITANTCAVKLDNIDGGTGTVTLPIRSVNNLLEEGNVAGLTPFTIKLSNCQISNSTTVSTYFEPGTLVNAEGRLMLSNESVATNVEIQLLNSEQGVIVAGALQGQNDIPVPLQDGSASEASLSYFAQYYATDAVTPGQLSSQVSYTIVYD